MIEIPDIGTDRTKCVGVKLFCRGSHARMKSH